MLSRFVCAPKGAFFAIMVLCLCGIAAGALKAVPAKAQPDKDRCAVQGVPVDKSNYVAYQDRGDRCEGLFRQQVAASAQLTLLGVHTHEPAFSPGANNALMITALGAKQPPALALRVLSSRPRQYYRLDAKLAPGGRFQWNCAILDNSAVRLAPTDVKALLCEPTCDSAEPRIFPASITDSRPPASQGVTLWLRAAVDLNQLFITLQGAPNQNTGFNNIDVLNKRLLPAGAAFSVFAKLKSGTYALRATAVPDGKNAMDEIRAQIVIP